MGRNVFPADGEAFFSGEIADQRDFWKAAAKTWKKAAVGHRRTAATCGRSLVELTDTACDLKEQAVELADFVANNERAWLAAKDEADALRKEVADLKAQIERSQEIPF